MSMRLCNQKAEIDSEKSTDTHRKDELCYLCNKIVTDSEFRSLLCVVTMQEHYTIGFDKFMCKLLTGNKKICLGYSAFSSFYICSW